jgi:hypothetical protein
MTHTSPHTCLKLHSIRKTVKKVSWLFWADSVVVGESNTDHTADWARFRQVEQEEQRAIRGACTSHAQPVGEQDRSFTSQTIFAIDHASATLFQRYTYNILV